MELSGEGGPSRRSGQGERGQMNPIGLTLVFGFVLLGSVLVVAYGASMLGGTQETLNEDRAEKALTQFDSKAALVALGNTDTQAVSFPTEGGDMAVREGTGWMNVTVVNQRTGNETTLLNESLGSVVYESGDTTIAYQGGGVWKRTGNNSKMVSPPEFHYRNGTLTLPVVTVSGERSPGDEVTISHQNTSKIYPIKNASKTFPDTNLTGRNPLENHKVTITVQSDYYIGWGSYFEERTDGQVRYDHASEQAEITLVVPANNPSIGAGLVSGSAGTTLTLDNNAEADSYNSTVSQYGGDGNVCNDGGGDGNSCPASKNTKITTAGDLDINNNGIVYGDVEVGGEVVFGNNGELDDGNISHEDGVSGSGWDGNWLNSSDHWVNDNASVVDPDPVSGLIDGRRDALSDPSNNDNADASDIDESTNTLQNCASTCTLTAGSYYLDSLALGSGENLELDTSAGNIEIVVDGNVTLANDQHIAITGDNRVNVYAEGNVTFENGAYVENADDDASQLWTYMNPDASATFRNNAVYRGVIYGPGASDPGTLVTMYQQVEVFGGLVGEINIAENNVWIHYDETLRNTNSVIHDSAFPRVTYLHVSVNRIAVTG